MTPFWRKQFVACILLVPLLCCSSTISQQIPASNSLPASLQLSTQGVGNYRFIAAHGRRSLLAGYASGDLEIWCYPFQILSGYRVAFIPEGRTTPIEGREILSRVVYHPDSVTRIYLGPGFEVREKLFVPLDRPAAILTYTVQSEHPVDIVVHATPILNLMWPAGLGGQSTAWHADLTAYVLSEPEHGDSAVVGSPQIASHDEPDNSTQPTTAAGGLGFTLRPVSGIAQVFVVLNAAHAADSGTAYRELIRDAGKLESGFSQHLVEYRQSIRHLQTPDERVNQAFAWSQMALDQAWVCNTDLGCGAVAGYGPSRGQRRPQYDWFFAGDGMVAADAALSAGAPEYARNELEFILRYQDTKTGMIWHELSQSAAFIDWAGKYPYMFVHVDITFQFLAELGRYVTATGDAGFLRDHWTATLAAYRYCLTVIDPRTGLPAIPEGKEGGNEQDRMSDDLGLSTSWIEASSAFAQLATLAGHADLADQASRAARAARAAIPSRYWDDANSFWISGHTVLGKTMPERRSGPPEALTLNLFSPQQQDALLDQFASSAFETDWGVRGIGAGSAAFDPQSYAKGSVWPVHTASLANAFWSQHRPATALPIWQSLVPVASLDSLGHFPEVLAGDVYREQSESVPEQTWSSAGFLIATIHGLLGLQIDSQSRILTFAPRLPADWRDLSLSNVSVGNASISLAIHSDAESLTLVVENQGPAFQLRFNPNLPLGAVLRTTSLNNQPLAATMQNYPQQTEAQISALVPHGKSEIHLEWLGGVSVVLDNPDPVPGEPGAGLRIVRVHLEGRRLTIEADAPEGDESHLQLVTQWTIANSSGVAVRPDGIGKIELTFPMASPGSTSYHRVQAAIEFKP
jgi:glycogen debranching enzyme